MGSCPAFKLGRNKMAIIIMKNFQIQGL